MKLHKIRSLVPANTNTAIAAALLASSTCISAAVLPSELSWNTTSAEIDVQGLAIQLIDLNTNDGISPQIFFSDDNLSLSATNVYSNIAAYESVLRPANTSLPLSGSDIRVASQDGSALSGVFVDGMYAGAGSSEALILQNAQIAPGLDFSGLEFPTDWRLVSGSNTGNSAMRLSGSGGKLLRTDNDGYQLNSSPSAAGFTLTPNTAVVFSGTLSSRVRMDLSQQSTFDPQTMQAAALAYGSVELFSETANDGNTAWSSVLDALAAVEGQQADVYADIRRYNFDPAAMWGVQLPGFAGPETLQLEMEDTKPFALTFTNDTWQAKGGVFAVNVQSSSIIEGMLPVPEPTTYALMALGLLGVAGAVRGRKVSCNV